MLAKLIGPNATLKYMNILSTEVYKSPCIYLIVSQKYKR